MSEYAERDIMQLDIEGGYYSRHVSAMTAEGLHHKGDIAAELAFRDREIETLRQQRDELVELLDKAIPLFCQPVTLKVAGEGRIELISFNLAQFQGQEVDVIVIPKAGEARLMKMWRNYDRLTQRPHHPRRESDGL